MPGAARARVKFDNDDNLLVSSAELCKILSLSPEMLSRHHKMGMPKAGTGWWNLRQVLIYLGQSSDDTKSATKSVSHRKLVAEADYKEAKAEREKKMLAVLEGQYIDKDDVVAEWAARANELKSSLMLLGKNIAKEFIDVDNRIIVENKVNELVQEYLKSYTREGKYTPREKTSKSRTKTRKG